MRNISANGLKQLATKLGNEPICIIEIDWVDGGTSSYADRAVGSIPGKIVELGDLDDAVNLSGNSGSMELSVTLDDTDGSIKAIMDANDPHKRPARVYQYFTGLDLSDRFLLFSGVLTTPISWNERDRTVKLTILSQLEDREIGFSAEEGGFEYLPASMVNKPWPVIFGSVMNNPCLMVQLAITGTTLSPVGILAGADLMLSLPTQSNASFEISMAKMNYQMQFLSELVGIFDTFYANALANCSGAPEIIAQYQAAAAKFKTARDSYQTQYTSLQSQITSSLFQFQDNEACVELRRRRRSKKRMPTAWARIPSRFLAARTFRRIRRSRSQLKVAYSPGILMVSYSTSIAARAAISPTKPTGPTTPNYSIRTCAGSTTRRSNSIGTGRSPSRWTIWV